MLASTIMNNRGWTPAQVLNACEKGVKDMDNPHFLASIVLSGTSLFCEGIFKDAETVIKEAFRQGTTSPR